MSQPAEPRPFLDDLVAVLRSIHESQQALVRELGLLRQEVRALRDRLPAPAPAGEVAPLPRAAAVAEVPAPEAPEVEAPAATAPAPPAPMPGGEPAVGVAARRQRTAVGAVWGTAIARLRVPERAGWRMILERTWLLALVVGLLVVAASELNLLQPVEVLAEYPKGWVKGERGRRDVLGQIVVIAIDEGSLGQLGPWGPAWRAHHGQILRNLAADGAKAVGFDVTFKRPNPEHDPAFLDGIRYARARGMGVVVGVEYDDRQHRFSTTAPEVLGAVDKTASVYLNKDRVTNLVRYVSIFQSGAGPDEVAELVLPALSLGVVLAGGRRVEEFPRYRDGVMPIDFAGPASGVRTVPYGDVHAKRFAPGTFKDKYVLVGAFFSASRDFFDTPVESEMPGVVIHAYGLYTLLRGIARPVGLPWSAAIIVGVACLTGGICARLRGTPRATLVAGLIVGYWGLAIGLGLLANPVKLEVVPATACAGLMWAAVTVREKVVAMRELGLTLGLPEEARRRLEQDPEFQRGSLGKRVTVLASDVRNYSAWSREQSPTHVRAIMSEYQKMVERVIYRHGGYINKFIGDAVIAVFGYPMSEESTARRCVLAAHETQAGLRALTEKWRREGKKGIEGIRIGINTGVVSISYLGSSKKQLDVMGSNVDLAARLESASGEFGCLALLGPETYEEVKQTVRSRRVPVTLKNRPDVTHAHTLDGLAEELVAVPGGRA